MLITPQDQHLLLTLARQSIASHFQPQLGMTQPDTSSFSPALLDNGASFVTLTLQGALRGCIGSLQAHQPLWEDVYHNASAAALQDPRFHPLQAEELENIHIEISVLGPLQEMQFANEADLLAQITPFEDGLVLEDGPRRGTFLPLVWEQLPDKQSFVNQLKLKAGLPPNHWSDTLRCYRYHTQVFEEA